MSAEKAIPAKFREDSYNCPICGVYSYQFWSDLGFQSWDKEKFHETDVVQSKCHKCDGILIWYKGSIVAPHVSTAPFHHEHMPSNVKEIYEEARAVFEISPRSSAAMLRLALQLLCKELDYEGATLDESIGSMVKNGLTVQVQQALDVVRVIGNNAVHPGQINFSDNRDIAIGLFALMNYIIERMIAEPMKIETLFSSLPEGAKAAIKNRDKKVALPAPEPKT
jgi:hypothetical protein